MAVNVAAQRRDPDSLLNWMERLIRRRRETPEIGWGSWTVLDSRLPALLAHRSDWDGRTFVAIHNLSEEPCLARVSLGADIPEEPRVHELLDTTAAASHQLDGNQLEVKLEGFGYRWFRIQGPDQHTSP
jgi:maltose alpha-D-glucosyltransferase/alpha-amylase